MTDVSHVADALGNLGFTEHRSHPAAAPDRVSALSHNGEYKVLGSWYKDDVIVHVEQNTAPDGPPAADGSQTIATYPPVIVIEHVDPEGAPFKPPHRLAVAYSDVEALASLLAGEPVS